VVLPDGRVWDGLRALRKDNTGYDLKQIFLGAEGTLGIITAAVLRLYPKPTASATAWIALQSPRAAVELLARLRERIGERISAFELVSRTCLEAVLRHVRELRDPLPTARAWYVLAQFDDSGTSADLEERLAPVLAEHEAVLAQSGEQTRNLWRIRESIPEAQFANVKHDISMPVSRIAEFVASAGKALGAKFPDLEVFCFGHVGDGNLHYNVGPQRLLETREVVNRIVYDAVEHGLGQLKREAIREHKSALELELMRTLKAALDPKGLMNPGKVL
jgi:FAD/FMN-containing dehydrogenase